MRTMVATGNERTRDRALGAPPHPGEVLFREHLQPLGISQSEFARRLGVSWPRLNEIIAGKRGITIDTALRLGMVLGAPSPLYWMRVQAEYDLWHAEQEVARAQRWRAVQPLPVGISYASDRRKVSADFSRESRTAFA